MLDDPFWHIYTRLTCRIRCSELLYISLLLFLGWSSKNVTAHFPKNSSYIAHGRGWGFFVRVWCVTVYTVYRISALPNYHRVEQGWVHRFHSDCQWNHLSLVQSNFHSTLSKIIPGRFSSLKLSSSICNYSLTPISSGLFWSWYWSWYWTETGRSCYFLGIDFFSFGIGTIYTSHSHFNTVVCRKYIHSLKCNALWELEMC